MPGCDSADDHCCDRKVVAFDFEFLLDPIIAGLILVMVKRERCFLCVTDRSLESRFRFYSEMKRRRIKFVRQ